MRKQISFILLIALLSIGIGACEGHRLDGNLSFTSGIIPDVDVTVCGVEGACALPWNINEITGCSTDCPFVSIHEYGDSLIVRYEQNFDQSIRTADIRLVFPSGETKSYRIAQLTAQSATEDQKEQSFRHTYAIGYSYNAVEGASCNPADVRGQVFNLNKIAGEKGCSDLQCNETFRKTSSSSSATEFTQTTMMDVSYESNIPLFNDDYKKVSRLITINKPNDYLFSVTDIKKVLARREIDSDYMLSSDENCKKYLTKSFIDAVEILETDWSTTSIDRFISLWGTHVVVSSMLGASIQMLSRCESSIFPTYYTEQNFDKDQLNVLFNDSDARKRYDMDKFTYDAFYCELDVSGGDVSIMNNAVTKPSVDNSALNTQMIDNWLNSVKYGGADSNCELVDFKLMSICDFIYIFNPELADKVSRRIDENALSLALIYGNMNFINTSFKLKPHNVTNKIGGATMTQQEPWVTNVICCGRYVATICREWVPSLTINESVYVVYPIYENVINLRNGLCVYDGKVWKVDWYKNLPMVKEIGKCSDANPTIYMTNGVFDVKSKSNGYLPSTYVLSYEWDQSIDTNGDISNNLSNIFYTRKMLEDFYIEPFIPDNQDLGGLPGWEFRMDFNCPTFYDYQSNLETPLPYQLCGIDFHAYEMDGYIERCLTGRMVRKKGYKYYFNSNEISL